jgi:two-component system, NtrC family, sensor histidine kinase HydH
MPTLALSGTRRNLGAPREIVDSLLAKALGPDAAHLAATEKQLLLSRLLARLAHEIRNPLSSLDIHVQLLAEDLAHLTPRITERTSNRLEIIRGEIHRLEALVEQFLRLARPSELDLQEVRPAEVLQRVCALLRAEATARGIEIVAQTDPDLPPLKADPGQLTQALVNLVINAIQAVERNGRIRITAFCPPETGTLVITVGDSGPGIPPERQAAVFEPFFTTKVEGSGLGLWIVQQIVTAHGGRVTVGRAPEGGAALSLAIPLEAKGLADG